MFLCVIYFQTAADASPVLCNVLSGTPDKTGSNTGTTACAQHQARCPML